MGNAKKPNGILEAYAQLEDQRDQLLEACKEAYKYIELMLNASGEDNGESDILTKMNYAINKVERKV